MNFSAAVSAIEQLRLGRMRCVASRSTRCSCKVATGLFDNRLDWEGDFVSASSRDKFTNQTQPATVLLMQAIARRHGKCFPYKV